MSEITPETEADDEAIAMEIVKLLLDPMERMIDRAVSRPRVSTITVKRQPDGSFVGTKVEQVTSVDPI